MRHLELANLATGDLVTCWPAPRLTLVAKARYALATAGPVTSSPGRPFLSGDMPLEGMPGQLRYAGDLVPFKPRADVILVGSHAQSPRARDKVLRVVVGDRRFEARPTAATATVAPFAALDATAPARKRYLGTYDTRWLEERWPWFPSDFDPAYFNAAQPALQLDGYLHGDERLALQELHPDRRYRTQLPATRVRCFLDERDGGTERFREVRMNLDTLFIDMDAEELALVWRGFVEVSDEDASGVLHVMWAEESLQADKRPIDDYHQALRIGLLDAGSGRASVFQRPSAPPGNDNAPMADDVDAHERAALDRLHAQLEDLGAPAEILELVRTADRVADAVGAIQARTAADPAQAAALAAESHRRNAELCEAHKPALPGPTPDTPRPFSEPWTRDRLEAAVRSGRGAPDADLRGLDLSRLDLSGAKLAGALLDGACLRATKLHGADLAGASLWGADLAEAVLAGACLRGADLTRACASGVHFEQAELERALFDGASLRGARLDGASAQGASFRGADLTGASIAGAGLQGARLIRATLDDAHFEAADLTDANLGGARGERVSFRRATLLRTRAGDSASFAGADLRGATADRSTWMGADLRKARFSRASLVRADLSRARLAGAELDGANCADADFTRSDLGSANVSRANFAGATFVRADLRRSDARGASFYEAELWRAQLGGMDLEGAHLAMSKLDKGASA
jgi:uncharacterized protein YjbI with pentapeptide repeats